SLMAPARHYKASFEVPLSNDPVLGAVFRLDDQQFIINGQPNTYYELNSYSFSANMPEEVFVDAIEETFEFWVRQENTRRNCFSDTYKGSLYLRQFQLRQGFTLQQRKGKLQLRGSGLLRQTAELATRNSITVKVNFAIYQMGFQDMKNLMLGE
ncbi:MAG: hypothetical protein R3356_02290, partial [Eudoraea sp.]|nr:hypothetical protein [Eudoraea sp.]